MDMKTFETKMAVDNGLDSLVQAREALARALREMDSYVEHYKAAEEPSKKADVLNWSVNHLASNILGNCRLDLLATRQAEIRAAIAK